MNNYVYRELPDGKLSELLFMAETYADAEQWAQKQVDMWAQHGVVARYHIHNREYKLGVIGEPAERKAS